MDDSSHYQSQREAILAELASITTIEHGTLAEEYREVPNPEGSGTIKKGPYFKHQCWENKKNRSKRITAQEAPLLREDLENGRLFTQLIEQLTELNIANARERRRALTQSESPADGYAKKNSTNKRSRKNTAKPKPSSTKSPPGSGRKDSKA